MIDSNAIIHPSAHIAEDVSIAPWTTIGANVVIESGTRIGSHVTIGDNTKIGTNNTIYAYASVGSDPQHISYKGEKTLLEVGDSNIIREFTTINRGTATGRGITRVGSQNYFMAYAHVAHDCIIGNGVVFANTASVAGHVRVDDHAILGAFSGVHQYCRVGAYSFLGRATKIYQDILPFMLVTGNPGIPNGLNTVGLKRHGFTKESIQALKKAYSLLHRRDKKWIEIRTILAEWSENIEEIKLILEMIDTTSRGIARSEMKVE
ncbi:MAG: acyl-[acyl-carrier-protein]--UDP-N-acetylglucosamine O-acyltransferase [Coxiella sp. RIFCSPHIGHO2_12_FULL_44_14]|nr:MAG: acyl-[acyl-carrier-protein]--UDP-N-acetylglucosamine O-acyltransferase [Coxiella sp. RIFCSPHIGHO2_12_FULL_44_14]